MTGGLPSSRGAVPPHRTFLRAGRFLTAVVAAGVWLMSSLPVHAQGPDRRDIFLTLRSRQALQKDREVADLRLTVQVRRGVATIWGPVPSDELTRRARKLVEQVPGVYEVRTDCYAQAPAPRLPVLPDGPPPAPMLPPQTAVVEDLPTENDDAPWDGVHVVTRHKVDMLPDPPPQREGRPAVALLAPVSLPAPSVPVKPDLWIRAERLCNSDPAYRNVKIDVKDGVVTLTGRVTRAEYRMALAQEIARLPGVERVSVGEVEVGR